MKLVPLPERPEPDSGADDKDDDGVDDEDPVEADEADGDVVALDDGEDGEEPGYEEADAEDETACVSWIACRGLESHRWNSCPDSPSCKGMREQKARGSNELRDGEVDLATVHRYEAFENSRTHR